MTDGERFFVRALTGQRDTALDALARTQAQLDVAIAETARLTGELAALKAAREEPAPTT